MYAVLQGHTTNAVGQDITSMAMDHTVYCGKPLVDFAVNVSLDVPWLRVLLDRFRPVDVVFDQIVL
jgi:hypothetical protein